MELLCRLLEVSRSGYYEWLQRKPSVRKLHDQALKRRLLALHVKYPALGLDSLYHLIRKELSCSRKRIHRLMNELGISSVRKRAYKVTTNSRHSHPVAPNLLMRKFSFDAPNKAWVGDITYIPTDEGWLYLATVKDLCSKQIVGYAFSDRIDTNCPYPRFAGQRNNLYNGKERGQNQCQQKNENTQHRRDTMKHSRPEPCGWSPSKDGLAGR